MTILSPVSPVVPIATSPPQSSKKVKLKKESQATDKALSVVVATLNALAKVPHAGAVCGPAAAILDAAQKVRSNRAEYRSLAEESGMLVVNIVLTRLDKEQVIDQSLKQNLDQLEKVLNTIRKRTERRAKRKHIMAFLLSAFDINEIKMQRQKLEGCMRLFEFQSLLELRQRMNQLLEERSGATEKTTANAVTFGNGVDFSNASSTAIGMGNAANVNTNNHPDQVEASTGRNSNNYGITGNGTNNVVNSGANSGAQLFANASHFMISGGEFNSVGGNSIRKSYSIDPGGSPPTQ